MHRFYLPPEQIKGDTIELTGSEAHHAAQVLRLRRSDRFTILDGAGNVIEAEIEDVSKKHVVARATAKQTVARLPYNLTLLQAIPKGKTMDLIIQKATELGVSRIVPLLSERVTVHLDGERTEDKRDKWQTVAIEAIKQCGQAWLPKVETPITPKDYLARGEMFELLLVGSLQPDSQHPRAFFEQYVTTHKRMPGNVCVWVGPEGDFTPAEMELLKSAGVLPITLGPLVLRCETAAIYCLSFLNYELQSPR